MGIFRTLYAHNASPDLRPFLLKVYQELGNNPVSRKDLSEALENLLSYLSSPAGRTHENCWATDMFFCLAEDWEFELDHVPEDFIDIIGDMGGALHDTVTHPEIALNFDSTPEQLLARVRALEF